MPYIANTQEDQQTMFDAIGCTDFADMWRKSQVVVPEPSLLNIPEGMSEFEVISKLRKLAAKNATELHTFLGAGYYDHIIPAAVGEITGRKWSRRLQEWGILTASDFAAAPVSWVRMQMHGGWGKGARLS